MTNKKAKEKRKISKWKILFIVAIILSFTMIFHTLYVDMTSLPSEGWSREVEVAQLEGDNSNKDYYYEKNFDIVENDGELEVFASDLKGNMEIYKISEDGQIKDIQKIENQIYGRVKDLSVLKANGVTSIVSATENEVTLDFYEFSDELYKLKDTIKISRDYEIVEFNENLIMYNTRENKYLWNIYDIVSGEQYSLENKLFDEVDLVDLGDKIVILAIENDKDILTFSATEIDKESGKVILRENGNKLNNADFDKITKKTNEIVGQIKANSVEALYNEEIGKIDVCFVIKNVRTSISGVIASQINGNDLASNLTYQMDIKVLDPNIVMIKSLEDEIKYLSNKQTFLGKKEVASTKKTSSNVALYNLGIDGDYKIDIKSKTDEYNPVYDYIKIGNYEYIVFNQVKDDINTIYLSSDNPKVIEISEKFETENIKNIIFGIFTVLMGSIIYLLPYLIATLAPILFLGLFVNLFCLNWVERSPNKILLILVLSYSALKMWYFNVQLNTFEGFNYLGYIPSYMTNNILGIILAIAVLIFAGFVMILYKKENPFKSYISNFIIFVLVDIIIFNNLFILFRGL